MIEKFFSDMLFDKITAWCDLGLSVLLVGFAIFLFSKIAKKDKLSFIVSLVLIFLLFVSLILGLNISTIIVSIALITVLVHLSLPLFAYLKTISKRKGRDFSKIYEKEAVINCVVSAVNELTRTKTGALITFEMKDNIEDDVTSIGSILNAPLSPELLTTIFYPGTRLHDGGLIIRQNFIYCAAAFYPQTEKPLKGKCGSRHRAAIGLSELNDSITVVVSEETGRISIAQGGELTHVSLDKFKDVLTNLIATQK